MPYLIAHLEPLSRFAIDFAAMMTLLFVFYYRRYSERNSPRRQRCSTFSRSRF
jgi:hypothetical protein